MTRQPRTSRFTRFPVALRAATLALVALLTISAYAQEDQLPANSQVVETQGEIEEVVVIGPGSLWARFWDWATEPHTLAIAVTVNFTFTLTLSVALTWCCRKGARDSHQRPDLSQAHPRDGVRVCTTA